MKLSYCRIFVSSLFLRLEVPNLHNRSPTPTGHYHRRLALERNSPDCFRRLAQLSYQLAGTQIPHLDSSIGATGYDSRLVELKARDAIVVGGKTMDRGEGVKGPNADGAIGPASHESVGGHLELADEGSMALEDGEALSVSRSIG